MSSGEIQLSQESRGKQVEGSLPTPSTEGSLTHFETETERKLRNLLMPIIEGLSEISAGYLNNPSSALATRPRMLLIGAAGGRPVYSVQVSLGSLGEAVENITQYHVTSPTEKQRRIGIEEISPHYELPSTGLSYTSPTMRELVAEAEKYSLDVHIRKRFEGVVFRSAGEEMQVSIWFSPKRIIP